MIHRFILFISAITIIVVFRDGATGSDNERISGGSDKHEEGKVSVTKVCICEDPYYIFM